jgi:hypothetical protein
MNEKDKYLRPTNDLCLAQVCNLLKKNDRNQSLFPNLQGLAPEKKQTNKLINCQTNKLSNCQTQSI